MIEKVTELLSQLEHDEGHPNETFIEKIRDDETKDLLEDLLHLNPDEIGGRVALAGFNYQFLVTLEYIIEMLDGKWDFVAVELHDDIVVGKENKVRFIQVKSSQKMHMKVSETGLLTRKRKLISGVEARINNSWLDKLLFKAKYFPSPAYQTEFELVTSYVVLKNDKGHEIGHYQNNPNFSLELPDDDGLVSFMLEDIHTKEAREIDVSNELCEPIKDILARFRIEKKEDLFCLERYINHLLVEFSKRIQKEFLMSENHLYSLIGLLMKKCSQIGNNQVLIIEKSEMDALLQQVFDNMMHDADGIVRKYASVTVIEQVFDSLCHQLKDIEIYSEIEGEINGYKNLLINWVENEGGSIRQLINRYIDGKESSTIFKSMDETDQAQRLIELFSGNLLLIFIYEKMVKISDKYSSILVKEISGKYLSFLSLNRGDTLEVGLKKVGDIIRSHTDPLQQLKMINDPPRMVLQGEFRGRNDATRRHTIEEVKPEIGELGMGKSLSKVEIELDIIPGGKLKDGFEDIFYMEDATEMRRALKEFWKTLE